MYGFPEIGIGFYGNSEKHFFHTPFIFVFGGGGGFDIMFNNKYSFFIECGWVGNLISKEIISCTLLQVGWRWWF